MFCNGVKSRAQCPSQCWQKWKATEWFSFSPFLYELYPVTPDSNQNLIFPHDSPSLRVNLQTLHVFSTFTMDLLVRSVDVLMNKIQIRTEKLINLCFNLYFVSIPFFHSPIFSYWPLLILPSCSLFLFAPLLLLQWKLCRDIQGREEGFCFWSWLFTRNVLSMGACLTTNKH